MVRDPGELPNGCLERGTLGGRGQTGLCRRRIYLWDVRISVWGEAGAPGRRHRAPRRSAETGPALILAHTTDFPIKLG